MRARASRLRELARAAARDQAAYLRKQAANWDAAANILVTERSEAP
jgi:hypothetical protein